MMLSLLQLPSLPKRYGNLNQLLGAASGQEHGQYIRIQQ